MHPAERVVAAAKVTLLKAVKPDVSVMTWPAPVFIRQVE